MEPRPASQGAGTAQLPADYLEPEIETMPRDQLERWQEDRLLELASHWYERSGLVRFTWDQAGVQPRDIRSYDDFRERVPFIDKDAIRAYRDRAGDPYGGLLCIDPAKLTAVFSSSGTTGDATFFPERWETWSQLNVGRARALWGMGLRPGDIVIPSPPATFRGPGHQLAEMCGAIPLIVNCWVGNWPSVFELIRRHRPAYMALSKPQLIDLSRMSDDHDLREIFSSFKAVSFAGEPLGAVLRQRMTDEWDMNLFLWTNAGDVGVAFECKQHDGCHIWEDTVVAEHLDLDSARPAAQGDVGELVVTAIDNLVAPLVRYRSDDLVRFSTARCGCGRTHARQWPVGRKGDETIVQGRSVLPIDVWAAIEMLPETADGLFQIIRPAREVDELAIRIGYRVDLTRNLADLTDRLESVIAAAVAVTPRLELVPEQELLARGTAATKTIPRVSAR